MQDSLKKEVFDELGNIKRAQELAQDGKYEEALVISENLKNVWNKNLQQHIVGAMVERNDVKKALNLAHSSEYQEDCLGVIAGELFEKGQIEESLLIINDMEQGFTRDNRLRLILPDLVKQNPDLEKKYLDSINGDANKVLAQVGIELGRPVGGEIEIDMQGNEILKEIYLSSPIVQQSESSQTVEKAKKEIKPEFKDEFFKAVELAESGEYEKSLKIAKKLESDETFNRNIQEHVIANMIEKGNNDDIEKAINLARLSKYENCLGVAARYLFKKGEKEKALSMTEEITNSESKSHFLSVILEDIIEQESEVESTKKIEKDESQKEEVKINKSEETKEKLEGEKLFNQQIENNVHPEANNIQTDVVFFLGDLDRHNINSKLEDYKIGIGEILYRNGIEYKVGKKIKIPEKDKSILEPLLELRKELDEWNTFTDSRVSGYRKRVFEYLKDTFGIGEYKPKEGEKFNGREQKAIDIEKTENKLLDKLIKKVTRPGYEINDELYTYYEKHFKEQGIKHKEELNRIKDNVSREEFNKVYEKYAAWEESHRLSKKINPANVIIYKYSPKK